MACPSACRSSVAISPTRPYLRRQVHSSVHALGHTSGPLCSISSGCESSQPHSHCMERYMNHQKHKLAAALLVTCASLTANYALAQGVPKDTMVIVSEMGPNGLDTMV